VALTVVQEAIVKHQGRARTTCEVPTSKCWRRCETAVLCNACQCSKAKFPERKFRQNFFSSPFSPSHRFRAQLFADFVALNINIGSGSLSLFLINTGFFSLWFSSILPTPLVFFTTREFITLFNCVFSANQGPLDVLKGPSNW
jgi:hypothetical protein